MRALVAWMIVACLSAPAMAAEDVWSASWDSATQTRYIPLELILGAPWDGRRQIALPKGSFIEGVARDASTWVGPMDWKHPDTGEMLAVYERSRRAVAQRFAVLKDGAAIGRVSDTRYGIRSCDGEAKYPLGEWKQGETRHFEVNCWYYSGGGRVVQKVATITMEEADFTYGGVAHSVRIHWILKRKDGGPDIDNRRYVFSPGLGIVAVR